MPACAVSGRRPSRWTRPPDAFWRPSFAPIPSSGPRQAPSGPTSPHAARTISSPGWGKATVKVLKALRGRGYYPNNGCCGLLPFNYGSLEDARRLAKANIERFEAAGCPGSAPVVGDCSSCVAFMKSYPQLFLDDPPWRDRAERFAARVRDAIETIPASDVPRAAVPGPITYHDSCRARNAQGLVAQPREVMRALGGEAFRELPEADACCGGAGAFAFTHPRLSDELLRRKTANIATTHARVVAASSTSCLIQLAHGLKKYYPECRVAHLTELVAESLDASAGRA
ncbi:MAG: (Fe-S)-binding protein [Elusimicrobiota bacterium]